MNRLYGDLSWLWPYWGSPVEYAPYAENVIRDIEKLVKIPVHTLLDVGCGGGKNIYNFKQYYTVTGLDLNPHMLEQARSLNPECEFVRGDMRSFDLKREFDIVLIDDSISYMTTETDLLAALRCGVKHIKNGGMLICGPDCTTENFVQNETRVTSSRASNDSELDITFIENNYDPDPSDTSFESLIIYIIRENGRLRIENDLHILGLFSLCTWRCLLANLKLEVHESIFKENDTFFTIFTCVKPGESVESTSQSADFS